jgi:hypothetical protein
MLIGVHKTQWVTSALTFVERYHKYDDELINQIVRVTGDETWV